jgi:hypothetical protein
VIDMQASKVEKFMEHFFRNNPHMARPDRSRFFEDAPLRG